MTIDLVCDYCHHADQKDLYMITLTGIKNTKNTCSKIICPKCAYHIQTLLEGIISRIMRDFIHESVADKGEKNDDVRNNLNQCDN